ncbi:protein translocase SEC61 complex subunit gamma [Candidatus Bathyarchaeota archaeon]|jgi:protein translocase SEC61 complex gamma subunit|nr:protein translocase SEC61 complex subunit gamma [Candidatus Bathyarchaeota archaeon]MDP6048362.1 protein translocase SEC61 complex subunit gamma [Candidatus Bathyarchaeota archaeon]MDP6458578.1 protein translocase SEC61 complex subunit gamma [Candidatus Bathyarchaeota archaeon]MDP7207211.1 protein translocase SEC61 complex subunit gamma [Candidatus Bathyarchaeota archaeon]
MGLGSFFQSVTRLLRTISRPDWKTYSLSIKIVFVGVAILGGIGFVIRLISATIQGGI